MINSPVIYKTYRKAFTTDECRRIENSARSFEKKSGTILYDTSDDDGVEDLELRKSDILFFGEKWIFEKVQEIVLRANHEAKWNLSVTNMEPLQFAEYAAGGYYDWHFDALGEPYGAESKFPGTVRKLSMSVLVNDPKEYEGGEFEINAGYQHNEPVSKFVELEKPGDVVVFPSLVPHRVRPVTNGVRKSLVCWVLGPPFV